MESSGAIAKIITLDLHIVSLILNPVKSEEVIIEWARGILTIIICHSGTNKVPTNKIMLDAESGRDKYTVNEKFQV